MEIIKIGSDSFKISLTTEEARELEITTSSDERLGDSVKALLDKSNLRSEIDFTKDRIATEIFVAKDGACDIFVSKQVKGTKDIKTKREGVQRSLYSFENIHNLCLLCRRLFENSYKGRAMVYYDKINAKYYLLLLGIYPKDIKYAFISEYGERVKGNLISEIEERCERICRKNPVEILSSLCASIP
ncbi:MAG: adaptor protein MecA [Ruminococcaceae bacterium]|nr:adaptor protein MecA [Oscillospiraceae bacterium]